MIVFFSPQAANELRKITAELVGIRIATERIANALETQPAPEPTSIEWHTEVPREET